MVFVFIGNPPGWCPGQFNCSAEPGACGQAGRRLLLAQPILRTTMEGEADEPAYPQLLAVVLHCHRALVDLAIVRVENPAARPLVAIFPEVPKNAKPDQRLALQLALTTLAPEVRVFRDPGRRVSRFAGRVWPSLPRCSPATWPCPWRRRGSSIGRRERSGKPLGVLDVGPVHALATKASTRIGTKRDSNASVLLLSIPPARLSGAVVTTAGLEFGGRRAHQATEGACEVALAREACRQTDFHEAGTRRAQHPFGALQPAFQYVSVRRHTYSPFEHSREVVQAQTCNPRQLAERQMAADVAFDIIEHTPRMV